MHQKKLSSHGTTFSFFSFFPLNSRLHFRFNTLHEWSRIAKRKKKKDWHNFNSSLILHKFRNFHHDRSTNFPFLPLNSRLLLPSKTTRTLSGWIIEKSREKKCRNLSRFQFLTWKSFAINSPRGRDEWNFHQATDQRLLAVVSRIENSIRARYFEIQLQLSRNRGDKSRGLKDRSDDIKRTQ